MAGALRSPALVVLLKEGCPCTRECHAELNLLAGACRGKLPFFGLLDAAPSAAKLLVRDAELAFPVIPDPKLTQIRRLDGRAALGFRLVGSDGKLLGRWDGLSRANVAAMVTGVRRATGLSLVVDVNPFTVLTKIGCEFSK